MMYIDKNGTLIEKNEESKSNTLIDKDLDIEVNIDTNDNTYIQYNDSVRYMTKESVLYWKKYISHNLTELKKTLKVKYFIIKFVDNRKIVLWA